MPPKNSEQTPQQKRRGNPNWIKGASGNPGGRPKVALAWKERCRVFLEQGGWDQLALIAHGLVDGESSLAAIKLMAEYAYGKPTQPISGDPDPDMPALRVSVTFDDASDHGAS